MPRKQECNTKTRVWEQQRRERLNECFTKLGTLLPGYDPAVTMSKVDILQKAAIYIQHLNQENQELLKGGLDESSLNQLKQLHFRVEELVKRTQQLSALLRDAGISIPTAASTVTVVKRTSHWSNKIRVEEVEALVKKVNQKRVEDRKQRLALRKLKADRTRPVTTKPSNANDKKKPLNGILNLTNLPPPLQTTQPPKRKKKVKKKSEEKSKPQPPIIPATNIVISEAPQRFIILNNSTMNSSVVNPAPYFVKPLILNQNIVKPNILTAPIMATRIQTCQPSIIESNPSLARLGPGTLILANGNIVPVLPPMLVKATNQTTNNQPVFMMTSTSISTSGVTTLATSPKSQRSLVPKPRRRDTTVTTFSNKVPIPALVSVDRSLPVVAKPAPKSSAPTVSLKTAKKTTKKKSTSAKHITVTKTVNEKSKNESKKSENVTRNTLETHIPLTSDNSVQIKATSPSVTTTINVVEDVTKISAPIQQISNLLKNVENVIMEDTVKEKPSQSSVSKDQAAATKRPSNNNETEVESKRTKLVDTSDKKLKNTEVASEVLSELPASTKESDSGKNVATTSVTKTSNSGSYTIDALCRLKKSSGEVVIEESSVATGTNEVDDNLSGKNKTVPEKAVEDVAVKQVEVPVTKEQEKVTQPVSSSSVFTSVLSTSEVPVTAKSKISYSQSKPLVPISFTNDSVFYKSSSDFLSSTNTNTFLPIADHDTSNVHTSLSLAIQNNDLSNDIFASLQVPQHPESISPTAAFLLAFPLVSTLKATELMDVQDEANSDSLHGTPTLLQIGNIEAEPRPVKRVEEKTRHSVFEFENYPGLIPPIISKTTSDFSPEKFLSLTSSDVCSDISKHNHNLFQSPSKDNPFLSATNPLADSAKPCHTFHIPRSNHEDPSNTYKPPKYCNTTTTLAKSTVYSQTNSYNYNLFPSDNSNNYLQVTSDSSSIIPWTTLASTTNQLDSFDNRSALPGIHEIYGKGSDKSTYSQGFKYRRESKAMQSCKSQSNNHRPPVNWMTAPDSRQSFSNQTHSNSIFPTTPHSLSNPIFSSASSTNPNFTAVTNHSISSNAIFSSAPNISASNPIFSSESNHLSSSSNQTIFTNPIFTSPSNHTITGNPIFSSASNHSVPTNPVFSTTSNNQIPYPIVSSSSNYKVSSNPIFSSTAQQPVSTNPIFSAPTNHPMPNPILSSSSNPTSVSNAVFSSSSNHAVANHFTSASNQPTRANTIPSSAQNSSVPTALFTSMPKTHPHKPPSSTNHTAANPIFSSTSNQTMNTNPIFSMASSAPPLNPPFTSVSKNHVNQPSSSSSAHSAPNPILSSTSNHGISTNPIFTAVTTHPNLNPIFSSASNHSMSNHIFPPSSNHTAPTNPILSSASTNPIPNPIFPANHHVNPMFPSGTNPTNLIFTSGCSIPVPSNPIFTNPIFSSSKPTDPANQPFTSAANRITSTSHQTIPTNPIFTAPNQTVSNAPIFPTSNQTVPSNQIFATNQSNTMFSGIPTNPIFSSSSQSVSNTMFPPISHSVPFASASDPPALANSITTTAAMMDPQRQFEQNLMFPGNNVPNLDSRNFNAVPFYGTNNIYAPNCQVDETVQTETGCYPLSWNPSPKKTSANGVYVPSTLPTLIGDLALGTNFVAMEDHNKQFAQSYDSDKKSGDREAAKRAKSNEYQNPPGHFLSVSQLVDQAKTRGQNSRRNTGGKPRQEPGYREVTPNWKSRGNYKAPVSNYSAEALIGNQSKQRDAMKVVTLPAPMVSERFAHPPAYNQRIPPPFTPDLLPTTNYFTSDTTNQNQNYGNSQNAHFGGNYNSTGFLTDNYTSPILSEAPNFIFPPTTLRNRPSRSSNPSYSNQCTMKADSNRNTFNARRMLMPPAQCGAANSKQKPRRRIPDPIVSTSTSSGMSLPEYLPMEDVGGYQIPTVQHKSSGIYPVQHHRVGNATASPNATNSLGTLTNFNLSTIFPEINDKHAPPPAFNSVPKNGLPPPGGLLPPPGQSGTALPPPDFDAPPSTQVCRMQWS